MSSSAIAQSPDTRVITGVVRDPAGGTVPYANLNLRRGGRVMADSAGAFRMTADRAAELAFDVRRVGYAPASVQLPPGSDTTITVLLEPVARPLPGVSVQAEGRTRVLEMNGFYRRLQDRERGINAGYFITAEDIEQRNLVRITQMIEGLPSIRVFRVNGLGTGCLGDHDPRCRTLVGPNECAVTVYVNGRRLNSLRDDARRAYAFDIEEVLSPSAVAGIEVYTSAVKAPPQYQSLAGRCGIVLAWTK